MLQRRPPLNPWRALLLERAGEAYRVEVRQEQL
jgi:hypothetical protein